VHLYQSDYARDYLQESRSVRYRALSDYTDQDFVHRSLIASESLPTGTRGNIICFFPNKGADLAARFIDDRANLPPDADMSRPQVRDMLFGARLYIDFGHRPGKHRVPRGAANHFLDYPLPLEYLFTDDDVASHCVVRSQ
jgi:hypothetical protein